jgi:hypothetical protein
MIAIAITVSIPVFNLLAALSSAAAALFAFLSWGLGLVVHA